MRRWRSASVCSAALPAARNRRSSCIPLRPRGCSPIRGEQRQPGPAIQLGLILAVVRPVARGDHQVLVETAALGVLADQERSRGQLTQQGVMGQLRRTLVDGHQALRGERIQHLADAGRVRVQRGERDTAADRGAIVAERDEA